LTLQANLEELSARDDRLRALRSRLDAGLRRRDAQQRRLDQFQQQHHEVADQIKHLRAHAHAVEQEAKAADDRTAKLREQMNAVKTNKEYSAMLVEVNSLKAEQSRLEEIVLEEMERIEEREVELQEFETKVAEQQKLVDMASAEVAEAEAEVGDQLTAVTKERDEAAALIPDEVLALYRKLLDDHDGEAVCGVEEQNKRRMEYTCDGCFMALPIEKVNNAITKPDQITQCNSCGRILIVPAEIREGLSPSKS
jgi:predicted  nucleic acid-binding Zn-ribbon protein